MTEPRRLPAAVRRARVLDAALALFAERGYQASMGDVAKAAGVTRTVVYHYFPSKQELFLAVLGAQAMEMVRHLAPAVAGAGTQIERGREVVDAFLVFAQERPAAWRLLYDHDLEAEPEVASARRELYEGTMVAMGELLAVDMTMAGIKAGSPRTTLLAEASLGASVATVRWWREHPEVPREVVTDTLFGLLWLGTGGLPAETG